MANSQAFKAYKTLETDPALLDLLVNARGAYLLKFRDGSKIKRSDDGYWQPFRPKTKKEPSKTKLEQVTREEDDSSPADTLKLIAEMPEPIMSEAMIDECSRFRYTGSDEEMRKKLVDYLEGLSPECKQAWITLCSQHPELNPELAKPSNVMSPPPGVLGGRYEPFWNLATDRAAAIEGEFTND